MGQEELAHQDGFNNNYVQMLASSVTVIYDGSLLDGHN